MSLFTSRARFGIRVYALLLLSTGFLACAHRPVADASSDKTSASLSIVSGCTIYDRLGTPLRQLPGKRCLFFDDGRYLSGTSKDLTLYDKNSVVVWRKLMHTHHLLTLTREGNFLVGTSEIHEFRKKQVRFDALVLISQDGRELRRFSYFSQRDELIARDAALVKKDLWSFNWDADTDLPATREFTHMNSYYEIPEGTQRQSPYFKGGSIVVNSAAPKEFILILDPELRSIQFYHDLNTDGPAVTFAHDVQILSDGGLLFYNNFAGKMNGTSYSSLNEIYLGDRSRSWQFVDQPPERFNSPVSGSVQLLANGHFVFSDMTSFTRSLREIDHDGHAISQVTLPSAATKAGGFIGLQEAKLKDVSSFLRQNQAL